MKKLWEKGIILFAVTAFWGMIYPDLCFTTDVCINVYEDIYEEQEKDMFTQICEARPDQIRVRSKMLNFIIGEKEESSKAESKGKSNGSSKQGDTQ